MACLMALPLAPQFVAFDRGSLTSHGDPVDSAAVSPSSFPSLPSTSGEPGVPARLDGRDARRSTKRPHAVGGQHFVPESVVSARSNAAPPRERVVEAGTSADQETVPEFRTLIFIEATQYGNSDSAVWRVQVWRVMLVKTGRDTLAGVAVAHST